MGMMLGYILCLKEKRVIMRIFLKCCHILFLGVVITGFYVSSSHAISLIRDSEIEHLLDDMIGLLVESTHVADVGINGYLINSSDFNAFVVNNSSIFVHSGAILMMDQPEELVAILAHELGHITDKHIAKRYRKMEELHDKQLFTTLAGIVIGAAGGYDKGVAAVIAGSEALSRELLSYSRTDEFAADLRGVQYMKQANIDPAYVLDVAEILIDKQEINLSGVSQYLLTHPFMKVRADRLHSVIADNSASGKNLTDDMHYRYKRVYRKIQAFQTDNPDKIIQEGLEYLQTSDASSREIMSESDEIVRYGMSIAFSKLNQLDSAIEQLDILIGHNNDPYYHELKGQFLRDNQKFDQALSSYKYALDLLPGDFLVLSAIGDTLIMANKYDEAIKYLHLADQIDPRNVWVKGMLAKAYAEKGDIGISSLMTSERFLLLNKVKFAKLHARRAIKDLPDGSIWRLRAQDVLAVLHDD